MFINTHGSSCSPRRWTWKRAAVCWHIRLSAFLCRCICLNGMLVEIAWGQWETTSCLPFRPCYSLWTTCVNYASWLNSDCSTSRTSSLSLFRCWFWKNGESSWEPKDRWRDVVVYMHLISSGFVFLAYHTCLSSARRRMWREERKRRKPNNKWWHCNQTHRFMWGCFRVESSAKSLVSFFFYCCSID